MEHLANNKYARRLIKEWTQHKRIIIAVDFDDTISPWSLNTADDCEKVIKLLKVAVSTGAYIVIFTACNTDRYSEIETYCASKGLKIDSINTNPINLPYGNQNKIYANIFLDDRAGLDESMQILEFAMYYIRGQQNYTNLIQQEF